MTQVSLPVNRYFFLYCRTGTFLETRTGLERSVTDRRGLRHWLRCAPWTPPPGGWVPGLVPGFSVTEAVEMFSVRTETGAGGCQTSNSSPTMTGVPLPAAS